MGHCGVGSCNKIHYLDSTCSGLLLKCWWAHIRSNCVYNTNSHLHTHFSEIWHKIKNEILGRTVLTTWLMISLHLFRWLFGNSWDNSFLSEFITCMLDATLSILPWLTAFKNTFSTYDTLINTHFVDKCNAFNVNRQKALKNINLTHILMSNMTHNFDFRIKELTHWPLGDAVAIFNLYFTNTSQG